MEMEDAGSELHWRQSVCVWECVCLCVQSNRGTHYHVLAFFNRLGMTCHFDLPARHPGSNTIRPLCVCVCVCTFVYVCAALTDLELFQGLKVWKPVGSPLHPAVKQKNWRLSTDLHTHTLFLFLPLCDSSTGSLSSLCFVWMWQTVQVAISPYHPPTAVSPYTTTRAKSVIFKLPWNIQYLILPCVLLCLSSTLTIGAKNSF